MMIKRVVLGVFCLITILSCQKNDFSKEEVFIKLYGNSLNQEAVKIIALDDERYAILASSETKKAEVDGELVLLNKGVLYFVDESGNQLGNEVYFPSGDSNSFTPTDVLKHGDNLYFSGFSEKSMAIVKTDLNGIESDSKFKFKTYEKENAVTVANTVFISESNELIISGYLDTTESTSQSGGDLGTRTPYSVLLDITTGDFLKGNTGGSGAGLYGEYKSVEGSGTIYAYLMGSEYSLTDGASSSPDVLIEKVDPLDLNLYDTYANNSIVSDVVGKGGYLLPSKIEMLMVGEYAYTDKLKNIVLLTLDVSGDGLIDKKDPIYLSDEYSVSPEGVTSDSEGNIVVVGTAEDDENGDQIYFRMLRANGEMEDALLFGGLGDEQAVGVLNANDGGFLLLGTSGFEDNKMINLVKVSKDGKIK